MNVNSRTRTYTIETNTATEEILILRDGQPPIRLQPSRSEWALLATAGLTINGRGRWDWMNGDNF